MHYKIIDDELNANLESLYERDAPNNLQRVWHLSTIETLWVK